MKKRMCDQESLQVLYEQAMEHNWRQAESPAQTALARGLLERATHGGHSKALRELSEMMFVGAGGPREPERAIALKWKSFIRGEIEALEDLSALLESYSEDQIRPDDRNRSKAAADKAEAAHQLISWIESYVNQVSQHAYLSVGQA
jgi:hypothetical protein